MARKKNKRHHVAEDLDLLPIMNLFMVLIPFLLLSTVFVKTTMIDIYLPQANATPPKQNQDNKKPLEMLTIHVTPQGFSFSGLGKSLAKVPIKGGEYDYATLTDRLVGLKSQYPESEEVILLFVADSPYETVIKTMDASRESINGGTTLFPNVSIGTHMEGGK